MVLELESEFFKEALFGHEFELAPFKKEVSLGVFYSGDVSENLANSFCDAGIDVFSQKNESPTRPFFDFEERADADYISFFFYIDQLEIMNFSVPVDWDEEKLLEKLIPVFRSFWETYFAEIMKVRNYNRDMVKKLSKKNTPASANLIFRYYSKIENNPDMKFFWLKKWASRGKRGKTALQRYYSFHKDFANSDKLRRIINKKKFGGMF